MGPIPQLDVQVVAEKFASIEGLAIRKEKFHGEWNYTILPKPDIG